MNNSNNFKLKKNRIFFILINTSIRLLKIYIKTKQKYIKEKNKKQKK